MPVTPEELAQYAGQVFENSGSEVELRAAASKAYYSAFHTLRPLGDMIPEAPDNMFGTHKRLCHQLMNDCPPGAGERDQGKIRELGQLLLMTRDARHQADYDLSEEFSSATAKKAVNRASEIRALYRSLDYHQSQAG